MIEHLHLSAQAPEPLWRQLHDQIVALIDAGAVAAGQSLPPERELALALGVSRVTVRRCYEELRHAQRLGGRGRSGSVVQTPLPRVQPELGRLRGFTEEMAAVGKRASTRLLRRSVRHSAPMAAHFGRTARAPLLHLERVRLADGIPMTHESAWYDLTLAPALRDWDGQGSAYARLRESCGLALARAEQTLQAVSPPGAVQQALELDTPHPCLLLTRHTYTETGALIEYVQGHFRGDLYTYHLPLTR